MSATARAIIASAERRTERMLFWRQWRVKRALVRVRRATYTAAFCAALFGGLGIVGHFEHLDQIAALEKERDAALVAEIDARMDAALLSECNPPLGILIGGSSYEEWRDRLAIFANYLAGELWGSQRRK